MGLYADNENYDYSSIVTNYNHYHNYRSKFFLRNVQFFLDNVVISEDNLSTYSNWF